MALTMYTLTERRSLTQVSIWEFREQFFSLKEGMSLADGSKMPPVEFPNGQECPLE